MDCAGGSARESVWDVSGVGFVGPYFEVESWRPEAGWRSVGEFVADDAAMRERVQAATSALARVSGRDRSDLEPRVVASTVSLGLFVRLVAPPLASVVLTGLLPRWSAGSLWWRPVAGGPWPLAASDDVAVDVGALEGAEQVDRAAAAFTETFVTRLVTPIVRRISQAWALSPQVLWGNVSSALCGAVVTLGGAVPERAETAYTLVERLLDGHPLLGTGELVRPEPAATRRFFVRRSCCLFYRVPGGGTCGDCVLTPTDVRRQLWLAELRRSS